MKESLVIIDRWDNQFSSILKERIENFGLLDYLKGTARVMIKPNLCAGTLFGSETGVVTNPDILFDLVQALLQINDSLRISIAESDSIGRGFAREKFLFQGYPDIFKCYPQVELVDLSRTSVEVYSYSGSFFKDGIVLSSIFKEVDLFISLGKMKTHINTVLSGCLKNQFGCLPDIDKDKYHPFLPDVVAEVNSVIAPDLCILEACPAMEGKGPVDGEPKDLGVVLFSNDIVAIDATAARIMAFAPEAIPLLVKAEQAGLGWLQAEKIEIQGISLEKIIDHFKYISLEQKFYVRTGLAIQRFGEKVSRFGHLLHLVKSTHWLVKKLLDKLHNGLFS